MSRGLMVKEWDPKERGKKKRYTSRVLGKIVSSSHLG